MGRCKQADHCGNPAWCKTTGECLKAQPAPQDAGHQAMWPQMIAALAAIDAELGLPDDGCNRTGQTLAAIRALKAKAEISQALAKTAMAGNWQTPVVHDHDEEPEPRYTAQDVADACAAAEIPDSKCESLLLALGA